jgi:tripeptidyl-peptidase II
MAKVPEEWTSGILPKTDTQAAAFIEKYGTYDGRNVIVAILDTGVDPGAAGLQVTSDGRPKVIDLVDATGSGDVDMSKVIDLSTAMDAGDEKVRTIKGLTGRTLKLPRTWTIRDQKIRLGKKNGYEIFPSGLKRRVKEERAKKWEEKCRALKNRAEQEADLFESTNKNSEVDNVKDTLADLKERVKQLDNFSSLYEDFGPVYDCVVFHDGSCWRAAVDVNESGDLTNIPLLTNFRKERQFSTFATDDACLNFACNIYDEGKTLSIVNDAGAHGTHVSGIVAANYPETPEINGIAPGAQIVGIRIGDSHLGSMETGTGLIRGLISVIQNKCDVVNMSYGEPAKSLNSGWFCNFANELVDKHNVIFVASAGNAGPALSSVGAPGGTTTSIISVGAYVSPHMMAAEYNMREMTEGKNYTWSSRGPAFDGDYGVSVSAPGGAITCVPNWTLQRNQLMNGTSMSSPNCAGNIAILLSALKERVIPYSPIRIRRAIENTASPISPGTTLDSGHGLVQIDSAFAYVLENKSHASQDIRFELSPRGVYLRQPHETEKPYVTSISVTPRFHADSPKQALIDFEMRVTLTATENWVQVCSHMVLMHGGRGFEVKIDPSKLPAGMHFAEIVGCDSATNSAGPMFRVPITIVIPEKLGCDGVRGTLGELNLNPGSIMRRFVAVPEGAQWLDLIITGGNLYGGSDDDDNSRIYMLHCQHVVYQHAHRDVSLKSSFRMTATSTVARRMVVHPGHTLEVCLAQYWSSLGDSNVTVQLHFRGVAPSHRELSFPGGENIRRVDLRAHLREVSLRPSGKLTKWRKCILPTSSSIVPGGVERDLMPNDKLIYNLELGYSFDQPSSGKVNIRAPRLNDLLYESDFGSQFYFVFDENKRLVGTGDAFEENLSLPKGKLTLSLNIRHESKDKLKNFEDMVLLVERKLEKDITLSIHKSLAGASSGGNTLSRAITLRRGASMPVFVALPVKMALPKTATAGDTLVGCINYIDGKATKTSVEDGIYPGGYPVKVVVPTASAKKKKPSESTAPGTKSVKAKLAAWYLEELIALKGKDDFPTMAKSSLDAIEAVDDEVEREMLMAKHLDINVSHNNHSYESNQFLLSGPQDKDVATKLLASANAVITAIDTDKIKSALGANVAADDKEGKKARDHQEDLKRFFVRALVNKAHAEASLRDVDAMKSTMKDLECWGKIDKFLMLNYRKAVLSENYGVALKYCKSMMDAKKDEAGDLPADHFLWKEAISLFARLDWNAWKDYSEDSYPCRFPEKQM